jgi:hypothetical protein
MSDTLEMVGGEDAPEDVFDVLKLFDAQNHEAQEVKQKFSDGIKNTLSTQKVHTFPFHLPVHKETKTCDLFHTEFLRNVSKKRYFICDFTLKSLFPLSIDGSRVASTLTGCVGHLFR